MESKQITAVEWLASELHGHLAPSNGPELLAIIEKAKAMEKEQIVNAYKDGNHSEMRGGKVIFEKMEKYYNETYGK
jgi:hypothetical protein